MGLGRPASRCRVGRYAGAVTEDTSSSYRDAGVDTAAGDLAVELMKSTVARTHGPQVLGGVGGFAGLFDVSFLKSFDRPLLATSTDGVGTKVAIAQAIDKHDTIGQDLVGMVVDDIVVVGAKPMFMTDYIACGRVVPQRIADIVAGIATACAETGTALVGGETAEHPGLLGPDDYDVAGAAVGAVEAADLLGPKLVSDGDVVIGMESSGLHSNGFSLVRHILSQRGIGYRDVSAELGGIVGEVLLEPTRLYTTPLLDLIAAQPSAVHALSHVTGGGIAANGSRIELQVSGRAGIPAGARSVVLNVTVDGPLLPGFVTVYPCQDARPLVSNVNYAAGQTLPNLVVTELSANGTVCLFNSSSTHIVVDVFGQLT